MAVPPRSRKEQRTTMHMKNRARRPVPASSKFAAMLQRAACDKHKSRNALCFVFVNWMRMRQQPATRRREAVLIATVWQNILSFPMLTSSSRAGGRSCWLVAIFRRGGARRLEPEAGDGWMSRAFEPLIVFVTTRGSSQPICNACVTESRYF